MTQKSFLVFQILALALAASAALLALPHTTEAAITFGDVTSAEYQIYGQEACALSPTCTLTAPTITGSNTVLILSVSENADGEPLPSSATYNGVSLGAPIDSGRIDFTRTLVWVVANPASAANFVVTWPDISTRGVMMAAYYTGVNQATPYRMATTGTGGTSPASLSVTNSQTNDLIVGFFSVNDTSEADGFTSANVGAGQTYRLQRKMTGDDSQLALSDGPGASGTVTHSWTYTDCGAICGWAGVPIPLISAHRALTKPPNNLGLVGYWSFDDGSGTKVTDFSGNGNHGTLSTNGGTIPSWTNGKRGNALNFITASNQGWVDLSVTSSVKTDDCTIAAWVKTTDDDDDELLGMGQLAASDHNFSIEFGTNASGLTDELITVIYANGAALSISGYTSANRSKLFDGKWHHVVVAIDTATHIYLDGISRTVTTIFDPDSGKCTGTDATYDHFDIGALHWSGGIVNFFEGKMDDVRFYNRTLSASEVAALYNQGTAGAAQIGASTQTLQNGTSLSNGLVGLWTFDGYDLTDKVYDRSGQGNNGYFVGGATSSAKSQGKLGQALNFDGTDDAIRASSALGASQDFYTMSAWLNGDVVDSSPDAANIAIYINDKWLGAYFAGAGDLRWGCNKDADFLTPAFTQFTTGWHLLTCTYDGTTDLLTQYLDGAQIDQTSSAGAEDLTGTVDIGGVNSAGNYYWDGKIDDIRIYNRALSAAEVKALYKLGTTELRP